MTRTAITGGKLDDQALVAEDRDLGTLGQLKHRGPVFVLGFALGRLLSSIYGFLAGAWPFGVLEAVWCLIAVRRYAAERPGRGEAPA